MLSADDRLELYNLVVAADDCATDRNAVAYAALFTQDAVMDGLKGNAQGKAAIQTAVSEVWKTELPETRHITTGMLIQPGLDIDSAVVTSTLLLVCTSPMQLLNVVSVRQQVQRVGGRWKISRRSIG